MDKRRLHKRKIKPCTLVRFICPSDYQYPFKDGEILLFLGEITQSPGIGGHCVVANSKGKVFWAYHTSDFEAVKKEDA